MKTINCFKAYDARGKVPDDLDTDIAYRIGRAYAEFIQPKRVAVGRDVRQSSDDLFDALTRGLVDSGVEVLDLGLWVLAYVLARQLALREASLTFVEEVLRPVFRAWGYRLSRKLAGYKDESGP